MSRDPIVGRQKGKKTMQLSFVSARQTAVSFAAAFLAAMLFVSAAVGPLPIA
jgi:hypothetical protein